MSLTSSQSLMKVAAPIDARMTCSVCH